MWRDPIAWLLIIILVLLGGVAWLTRHPHSPALDRLAGWPVVGPLAAWFRAAYRPPSAQPAPAAEPELVVLGRPPERPPPGPGSVAAAAPRRRIWIRPGTELRQLPAAGSAVTMTVPAFVRMELLERRGDWSRVRRVLADGRSTEGWARLGALGEPSAEELWRPEPVLPLPASSPAPELVAGARQLMRGGGRETVCGPYRLLDDLGDAALAERCARLVEQLERVYTARYGVRPAGPPEEAILVFRSHGAYLLFRARSAPESRRHAFAAPASGIVALAGEGRVAEQLQATLVHELVHLMNRRFLGPALPPWLDEGLAEELAMSRFEADGTLVPGSLGRYRWQVEGTTFTSGGEVELARLRRLLAGAELPTLEELVRLDRAGFQAEGRFSLHYTLSAFWVRYLLSGDAPAQSDGFRAFLGAVASGERLDEELLLGRLGVGWGELEAGFRSWLVAGGSAVAGPPAERRGGGAAAPGGAARAG